MSANHERRARDELAHDEGNDPSSVQGCFEEVCVVSATGDGEPLRRADLARGPGQLVVIPDEGGGVDDRFLERLGGRVRRVRLEIAEYGGDGQDGRCREYGGGRRQFRLLASIALAEIARQVGEWHRPNQRPRGGQRDRKSLNGGGA